MSLYVLLLLVGLVFCTGMLGTSASIYSDFDTEEDEESLFRRCRQNPEFDDMNDQELRDYLR